MILPQTMRLSARSLAGWMLALTGLTVLYVSIWPSMRDLAGYRQIMENMPEAYRSVIAASGASDLTTAVGYLNAELFSLTGPLLVIILGVTAGTGAIAGLEHSGVLAGYLANPVSRRRFAAEQALACWAQVLLLMTGLGVVLTVTRPLGDIDIPIAHLAGAVVHLAALGLVFASLAFATGAATGRPVLARVVTGLAGLVAYIVHALASMVSWLGPLRPLSPFHWYGADSPLATGAHPKDLVVLVVIASVITVLGVSGFTARDLRS